MFWGNYLMLCADRGLSPNAVAAECGIKSSGTVTGWKNGSVPRDSVLIKIADYFGCTVSDLLGDTKMPTTESDGHDKGNMELRGQMRDELRILYDAAEDAPASALLEAAALIMRYKEQSQ